MAPRGFLTKQKPRVPLTRKPSESIVIGKNLLNIKVLSINGSRVKIEIEAPKGMAVHREEIHERILLRDNQGNDATNKKQGE